ncbi:hypothetical protein [Floridanema aerugineum]|uniref:Uncharacterized protein n=1 Tax=Floridaenema aerugineum BLCC-F46 TaxID=3153654 RepID=A0ABV4XBA8_9CYAN
MENQLPTTHDRSPIKLLECLDLIRAGVDRQSTIICFFIGECQLKNFLGTLLRFSARTGAEAQQRTLISAKFETSV